MGHIPLQLMLRISLSSSLDHQMIVTLYLVGGISVSAHFVLESRSALSAYHLAECYLGTPEVALIFI